MNNKFEYQVANNKKVISVLIYCLIQEPTQILIIIIH